MRELCNCNTCIYHDVDVCGHHVCFASIDWLSPDINSDGSQCSSYISISDGFQYQLQLE